MLHIGVARLGHGVVVDVDHVVEHAHRGLDGALELGLVDDLGAVCRVFQMGNQIDRAEIAHRDLALVGVERDLGAEVARVHHAHMLLRAAHIARILEGDPGMAGFEKHGQHLAPQLHRRQGLEQLDFAQRGLLLVAGIDLLEVLAELVVQIGHVGRAEQRPVAPFHHPLHE